MCQITHIRENNTSLHRQAYEHTIYAGKKKTRIISSFIANDVAKFFNQKKRFKVKPCIVTPSHLIYLSFSLNNSNQINSLLLGRIAINLTNYRTSFSTGLANEGQIRLKMGTDII